MNDSFKEYPKVAFILLAMVGVIIFLTSQALLAEGRLGARIRQVDIDSMSLHQIRTEGRRIFSTPFNFEDGLGDGPLDLSEDPAALGGRPSMQGNGFILRFNGNDSQTCLECHSILSNDTIPASFAVGGAGGLAASAFPGVINPDIDDDGDNGTPAHDGHAAIGGRMVNPPFNFGAGGVEALAKEMTTDLQVHRAEAQANPGQVVDLLSKGVSFGSISSNGVDFDTSNVEGIDDDLVVRPFGRKGCCFSIRDFDRGAMQFHHGMQPEEVVGSADADGDGVAIEVTIGEMSALHIFQVALKRPKHKHPLNSQEKIGKSLFSSLGCARCHIPKLILNSNLLPVAFPEVPTDPSANVFRHIDLTERRPGFKRRKKGGVLVHLFADLKRHDMGSGLAESTGGEHAASFTTARLWGVADTAPYLHDGRALTLSAAILAHGGEAQNERDNFHALSAADQDVLVKYLRTLHTPKKPSGDLE